MRKTRIYVRSDLKEGASIRLEGEQARYLNKVLRLDAGANFILFNGKGGEFEARVERATRDAVDAQVVAFVKTERESPLDVTLVQGLSRGERMDFTIQKAVELGVHVIVPVTTERSVIRLDGQRRARRLEHWRSIAVNACQQCGRTRLPRIDAIASLDDWLANGFQPDVDTGWVLSPGARLKPDALTQADHVVLLIGPEGGLSDAEMARVTRSGLKPLSLGPRILRTETAAVAALTALQLKLGDLSGGL
ncbi:MAG: 16S rRNA (uracil(1498)-N(3))-methyltransferase [Gammaproteobacteria bacterium]|nr:16S rRNA (uracil(1498)-N(3))-methyltransferase [Gammaproteobacteria bacterium]